MRDDRQSGKTSQEKQNNLQIDVWNQMLAEKAAAIIEQRMIYVQRINEIAEKSHAALSSGKEKLNVKYKRICHKRRVKSLSAMSGGNCGGLNEPFAAFVKEIGCAAADGNGIAYPSAGNIS